MSSYMLRGIPDGTVSRAKAIALESGTTLDAVLLTFLIAYAEHGLMQSKGGHARAAALTPARRSAIARQAGIARQKDRPNADARQAVCREGTERK